MKILKTMYDGELYPDEVIKPSSDKYYELIEASEKLKQELDTRLDNDEKELLELLLSKNVLMGAEISEENFYYGFNLGINFQKEIAKINKKYFK